MRNLWLFFETIVDEEDRQVVYSCFFQCSAGLRTVFSWLVPDVTLIERRADLNVAKLLAGR